MPAGGSNLQIELLQDETSYGAAAAKPDGSFTFWRLDPGKYTATAYCQAGGQRMRSAPAEIEVGDANVDHVDLRIIPPADLAGQVAYDDDEAKQSRSDSTPARLTLEDLDRRMAVKPADIGPGDAFRVPSVSPGRYLIRLSPRSVYVKAVRLGSAESAGSVLDIRNGAAGISVTLVLSGALGAVTGSVTSDGGPAVGARVALIPETPDLGLSPRLTSTTPDGSYAFEGVPPGRYKLLAADPDDGKTLEDYADMVEHIEVQPRDRLIQDLAVPSQFRIGVRK